MNRKKNSNDFKDAQSDKNNSEKQILISLFEINVIRYALFMENIKPEYIDPFFMIDFMSLPEDYFLADSFQQYGNTKQVIHYKTRN